MQRLEVGGAVRPLYGSLGVKGLMHSLFPPTQHKNNKQTNKIKCPVFTEAPLYIGVGWGSGDITPFILNLVTS